MTDVQIKMLRTCRSRALWHGGPLLRAGDTVTVPDHIATALVAQSFAELLPATPAKSLDAASRDKMQHSPQAKKG